MRSLHYFLSILSVVRRFRCCSALNASIRWENYDRLIFLDQTIGVIRLAQDSDKIVVFVEIVQGL